MQNLSELFNVAKENNRLNTKLKGLLPDNLKNIDLVKVENDVAVILVPNSSILHLAKSIDLIPYFRDLNLEVKEIKLEIRR